MRTFDYKTLDYGDLSGLLIRALNWKVKTAGPSPNNNERIELFLLGCKKAMSGNPCKGCFNPSTHDASIAEISHDAKRVAEHINNVAESWVKEGEDINKYKYITIGGGEPTDQIDNLIILCKELKNHNFHVMMYTWRTLLNEKDNPKMQNLLQYVDIVVDGPYIQEERLWDGTKEDGLLSSVGSGNQIIWNIRLKIGIPMKDIEAISLKENGDLFYTIKNVTKMYYL